MTYSIIQKSQLEGALRLDAEYYQPEYYIDFSKGNWQPLGKIISCQYGLSKAMNDEEVGQPMYKMDNINNAFLIDDNIRYSNITKPEFQQYKLNFNDVLFNRVNSEEFVGRTGIFKKSICGVFASYLIRLRIQNNKILPDYLNIFLNTKFGQKQIRRFARRAVNQANVNAEELKQFKIAVLPIEFQREIESFLNVSWECIENSKNYYKQAEDLLLEELGLKNFDEGNDLFSIVNLSDVQKANRLDAEYFQEKYSKVMHQVVKIKNDKLETFISSYSTGYPYQSQNYQENGYPLIRINNIKKGSLDLSDTAYLSEKDFRISPKDQAKTGDLILSMSGTIGSVTQIPNDIKECCVNQRILKFTPKNINSDYLILLLNSLVGSSQLERIGTGGVQTNISYKDIKNILIPILSKQTQQKIADLVRQSHSARQKSKELLSEAKRKVEEMIEKGEK